MSRTLSQDVLDGLARIVGAGNLSVQKPDLLANARDNLPAKIIDVRDGIIDPLPQVVVRPGSAAEISKVFKLARKHVVPVTPYAAGSGVCGGVVPLKGGISLDVKRLDRILELDGKSQVVRVQAGMNGEIFERELNAAGFTHGHFPSSIYTSTVGGWLAARSAGQFSSLYGKIEDMVESLEVVLPDGTIVEQAPVGGPAVGPDWRELFVGSEGTLGVITAATIRIHRFPEERAFASYLFPDVLSGLTAFRELLQAGLRPSVMRLYDEVDTFLGSRSQSTEQPAKDAPRTEEREHGEDELWGAFYEMVRSSPLARGLQMALGAGFSAPRMINRIAGLVPKECKAVLLFEGEAERCNLERELAHEISLKHGAKDKGEGPARRWLKRRYAVSYGQSKVFDALAFADTMEVAASWEKLPRLYLNVREAISRHALVMAHFSHAYPEGCSIYFTFVGAGANHEQSRSRYDRLWKDALSAALRAGGTCTHHHGVGMLKASAMAEEHGAGMRLFQAAKDALDEAGLANPGKLGLRQ